MVLSLLLDGSPYVQVLFEVAVGGDLKGVVATRAAYRSGLLLADDVAGRTIDEILQPESASLLRDGFRDSLRLNEPVSYEEFARFAQREAWVMTTLTPLFDDDAVPAYIVASFLELDFLERTESALSRIEASLRQLIEASSDAIFVVERGRVVHVNEAGAKRFGPLTGEPLEALRKRIGFDMVEIPLADEGSFLGVVREE